MSRFHIHIPQEKLLEEIRSHLRRAIDSRQVARRLKELMPSRLFSIRGRYLSQSLSRTKALRQALLDKDYLKLIDEYVEVSASAHLLRVEGETRLMLHQARQTLRGFHIHRK